MGLCGFPGVLYAAIMIVIATNAIAVIPIHIHRVSALGSTIELMIILGCCCISSDINAHAVHIDDSQLSRDSLQRFS